MTATRHNLVALIAPTAAALALSAPAYGAGTRAGPARAAKRHTIAHVERYGIVFAPATSTCGARRRAVALEVLRLRQRRPMHGHRDRGVLDTRTDLPGAEHRHRLRRMMSRYRGVVGSPSPLGTGGSHLKRRLKRHASGGWPDARAIQRVHLVGPRRGRGRGI